MRGYFQIAGTPAYHSAPDGDGKRSGLIVIEEIWGLNDHIKSVADRFAAEGYNVISPELLPPDVRERLTPRLQTELYTPEKRSAIQPVLRAATQPLYQPEFAASALKTLRACVDFLLEEDSASGKVGVVGFCFGGTYAYHLAAHDPRIDAAVPFYGQPPEGQEVSRMRCPILAFYGENDARLMESLPLLREAMMRESREFESVVYAGAGHAFFNDTNTRAFNAGAAEDSWKKTLGFLRRHVG